MAVQFYWYPKCGTARKAKKWLEDRDIPFEEIHIVEETPSKEQIEAWYKTSGLELKKFFNTSGKKYRELNMKEKMKTATDEELLELLASDGMLIKRPIAVDEEKVTIGFKEEDYEKTWGNR